MVSRLQRILLMAGLLLAAAWAVFWWPRSPTIAAPGIAVLLLAHAVVLALEFVAAYVVSATDAIPRATAWQSLRAWLAECLIAPCVFCWYQPFRADAVPDSLKPNPRRGAVFIHGYLCNRGFWMPWLRELRAKDRAFIAINLEPVFGSIDSYTAIIDDAIARVTDATGLPPVLICHSMGGLAARAWLRDSDATRVHRIVTIGSPHRGTWLARFGHSVNGREMRVGGEWLQRFERHDEDAKTSEAAMSSAPSARFTCWYSNCDNIVFPASTAMLPGADNRLCDGRAHVEMAFDAELRRATLALLDD